MKAVLVIPPLKLRWCRRVMSVFEGVYRTTEDMKVFHPVHAITAGQLQILFNQVTKRGGIEFKSRI